MSSLYVRRDVFFLWQFSITLILPKMIGLRWKCVSPIPINKPCDRFQERKYNLHGLGRIVSLLTHDRAGKLLPLCDWAFPCDPQLYEYDNVQSKLYSSGLQECLTSIVFVPRLTRNKCNPQPNPNKRTHNSTQTRVIIVRIYRGQYKKSKGLPGGSRRREFGIFKQL